MPQAQKATPFTVAISYERITPESAEQGEADSSGWLNEGEELTLGDTLSELRRYAPYEVEATYNGARLSEVDAELIYATGERESRTVHVTGTRRAIERLVRCLERREQLVGTVRQGAVLASSVPAEAVQSVG